MFFVVYYLSKIILGFLLLLILLSRVQLSCPFRYTEWVLV